MAETIIEHVYHLKGGVQEAVELENPILDRREPIIVYCTDGITRMKIGDGIHHYNELEWIGGGVSSNINIMVDNRLSFESTNPVQNKIVTQALDSKVDKEVGKGLSTNDFTNEAQLKLNGIEEGATKVIVDNINLDENSGNAISNSLVARAITNINTTMVDKIEDKVNEHVNQVIENISLDGGQI